jgi:hypothetical protein
MPTVGRRPSNRPAQITMPHIQRSSNGPPCTSSTSSQHRPCRMRQACSLCAVHACMADREQRGTGALHGAARESLPLTIWMAWRLRGAKWSLVAQIAGQGQVGRARWEGPGGKAGPIHSLRSSCCPFLPASLPARTSCDGAHALLLLLPLDDGLQGGRMVLLELTSACQRHLLALEGRGCGLAGPLLRARHANRMKRREACGILSVRGVCKWGCRKSSRQAHMDI